MQHVPEVDESTPLKTLVFPLLSQNRRVGHGVFTDLAPNTSYMIKAGYMWHKSTTLDSLPDTLSNLIHFDHTFQGITFTTPPLSRRNPMESSFVYGSCNRFIKIGPLTFFRKKGEKIFQRLATDIQQKEYEGVKTHAIITLGDFVYMDPMGSFLAANSFQDMARRYEAFFNTKAMRNLGDMGIPLIQMRDDHEDQNNSSGLDLEKGIPRAQDAQKAYKLYQGSFGGATPTYFPIEGPMEAFMMDIRSERNNTHSKIISDAQMLALKKWLTCPRRQRCIKPVFMSNPILMLQSVDGWAGYRQQQSEILTFILEQNIAYVCFFTGDIHVGKTNVWRFASKTSHADLENDPPYILEDASSAFHKFSHPKSKRLQKSVDLRDFDGPLLETKGEETPIITRDHFTRVSLDHAEKTVTIKKITRCGHGVFFRKYNLETGKSEKVEEAF